ncbi:MAG: hypothetical protein WCF81_20465 [Roseiarcus sp.]
MRIVRLKGEIDFEGFRQVARSAAARGVRAEAIRFVAGHAEEEGDLFSEQEAPEVSTPRAPLRVPPRFLDLADLVCRHRERTRYDLLYAALLRLRETRASWRSLATRWCDGLRTWSARCGAIGTR